MNATKPDKFNACPPGEAGTLGRVEGATVALSAEATDEQFAVARNLLDAAKERLAEFERLWKGAALERCLERGDLVLGSRRFYAATPKETKCRNVKDAIVLLYEVTGGDFEALVGCLSANAMKPGACRTVLGERFGEVFETTVKVKLEEGKARGKELIETNDAFSRKGR